jgi:hypothetical protein
MSDADTTEAPTCECVHLRPAFPTPLQKAIYDAADELFLYRTRRKAAHLHKAEKVLELAMELADKVTGSRNCPGCDQPFTPARKDNLYCSSRCRQRAFRLKRREA